MLLIQLRIEKTRKCPILYFLSNYQSDRQARPEEEMRNECWIVGCLTGWHWRIKTLGLFRLPCTAGLCWVLYQIISKFSSYSAFQYCRCRGRERDRSAGLSWGQISFCGSWFRNWDKIPFLVRLQLTVSTNHKICLLLISLEFISVRSLASLSREIFCILRFFRKDFKKLRGNPRMVVGYIITRDSRAAGPENAQFKGKIWNLNSAQWRAAQTPAGSHLLPSCNTEYPLQQKDRQKFKFQTDLEFSEFLKVYFSPWLSAGIILVGTCWLRK